LTIISIRFLAERFGFRERIRLVIWAIFGPVADLGSAAYCDRGRVAPTPSVSAHSNKSVSLVNQMRDLAKDDPDGI
jgi:hypothetical protein